MDTKKVRVGVIFGGKSAEHDVSLQSAESIIKALDRERYESIQIKIERDGSWQMPTKETIDVAFPMVHGTFGEDGTMQGLLEILDIPYVGVGVLGSAVAMDKDMSKRLMREAGLPVAQCSVFHRGETATSAFGWPVFVKPANLGSSVGISKSRSEAELSVAAALAFRYDHKILVEEFIEGRELDCAVMGDEALEATMPAEITTKRDFYDYQAKYVDEATRILVPAEVPTEVAARVKELSVAACKALSVDGMARVELFLKKDGSILLNEVNTIPGFTSHSIFPRLWEKEGVSISQLLDRLIHLALKRHAQKSQLSRGI